MGGPWLVLALVMLGVANTCISSSFACSFWRTKTPYVLVSPLVGCSLWGRGVAYCTLFAPSLLVA